MDEAIKHIEKLGLPVRDAVSGFSGIITTVSFDLYGCVQCWVTPPASDKGLGDGGWFDAARLQVTDTNAKRAMPLPDFDKGYVAEGRKGAARLGPGR